LKNACPSVVLFVFVIVKLRLQQISEREYDATRRNNIERIYSFAQKFFVTKKHIRMQKSSTFNKKNQVLCKNNLQFVMINQLLKVPYAKLPKNRLKYRQNKSIKSNH